VQALAVLDRVLDRLREEWVAADRAELFEQIKPWLLWDPDAGEYASGQRQPGFDALDPRTGAPGKGAGC
jgi:hypothetical protein